jgi:hypothetical protein
MTLDSIFERRSRLVLLVYAVIGGMDPPPDKFSYPMACGCGANRPRKPAGGFCPRLASFAYASRLRPAVGFLWRRASPNALFEPVERLRMSLAPLARPLR